MASLHANFDNLFETKGYDQVRTHALQTDEAHTFQTSAYLYDIGERHTGCEVETYRLKHESFNSKKTLTVNFYSLAPRRTSEA